MPRLGNRVGAPLVPILQPQPADGGTNALLAQEHVETLVSPTSANARLAQEHAEVLLAPTSANARLAQIHVEVLQRRTNESIRVIWEN